MENINKQPYLIFIAIIIAGLMVAGAIVWQKDSGKNSVQPASSAKIETDKKTENVQNAAKNPNKNINPEGEGDDPTLGSPEATLTMTLFQDFQCHFCKQLKKEVFPQLVEKYVKTGKIKIIERDFPFLGKESVWAAEAANCGFEQNKYWEYSDILHSTQTGHDTAIFSKENLKSFAQKLNLDAGQFNECLDSDKYLDEVKKDFEAGQALGVTGTPTTFINKEILSGALPFEEFEKAIETALSQ